MAISCIIVIGYWVNPFEFMHDRRVGDYGQSPFNARIAKLRYVENMDVKPDAFVLGTSNTMRFLPDTLNHYLGHDFYNFGVYKCTAEDYLCITKCLVEDVGCKPKMMFIGLDQLSFRAEANSKKIFYGGEDRLIYKPRISKYLPDFNYGKLWFGRFQKLLT
ncbi:MAG: hypothetical protein HRT71_13205 [Flavobacteriales bacterium]|nr:hypothetical protein [Flavobacteriales bacterium]